MGVEYETRIDNSLFLSICSRGFATRVSRSETIALLQC